MARRRQKKYSIGNSRSGLGLGRRSMFVSQEKQAQHQAARRLKIWSRIVAVVVSLSIAGMAAFFVWFWMVPYFHQELIITAGTAPEASMDPLPDYDSLGLPIYDDEVNLFTINQASPATADFAPKLAQIENIQVDARIADALRQLVSAAKEEGLILIFSEGYVSYEEQGKRFDEQVEEMMDEKSLTAVMAKTEARAQTPMAGESDFQTGLCLRLAADKETFPLSKTYSWLRTNMGRYGFVFRFPEDKDDYTGVSFDPTVLRYVGGENAAAMQQRSMCLEEYIAYLGNQ